MVLNNEAAIKTAIKLAELNIQSANRWVTADLLTEFMDGIYNYLTDKKTQEN